MKTIIALIFSINLSAPAVERQTSCSISTHDFNLLIQGDVAIVSVQSSSMNQVNTAPKPSMLTCVTWFEVQNIRLPGKGVRVIGLVVFVLMTVSQIHNVVS